MVPEPAALAFNLSLACIFIVPEPATLASTMLAIRFVVFTLPEPETETLNLSVTPVMVLLPEPEIQPAEAGQSLHPNSNPNLLHKRTDQLSCQKPPTVN